MGSMIDLSGDMTVKVAALDYDLAKIMAEALHKAYPGHLWAVTCEGDKGIATVRNLMLAGNWGFVLHLNKIYSISDWEKTVIRAGGEMLERFRQRRGTANQDALADIQYADRSRRILVGDYAR